MEKNKDKYIVVKEVIRKKNPKLLKWIPSFALRYIERVVHEDDINKVMAKNGHLDGLEFVDALIEYLGVNVELQGEENIPLEGGVIFASNHPLGGLDGVAFMHAVGKYRKDIKFIVNDILLNVKNLQPLFVGVNKHGAQGRKASLLIDEAYRNDNALLVFPAGLVSRKQKHGIEDLEWKKSFISQSKKYKKDIIPVYIDGKNSNFFYNFAHIRKKIGIKANIEMFYLPDEMFSQQNKTVTIHIGKPIPYTFFDDSKTEKQWAQYMKQETYNLSPKG
ncbi:1-acyl-sn-glycerol-3-phosphate acyltransferase [Olivibacter sitiensis]|uniref:1-acyl-sn-glycerol-3-phosphate acyltransferase n=1 Tax=Olivibacter sitiensis TaxID=376470 RepID=UPI000484E164|nr:1-acyl-sn-glycerol-3-phosphate acyltransferase [Olivibacter sitiensis]